MQYIVYDAADLARLISAAGRRHGAAARGRTCSSCSAPTPSAAPGRPAELPPLVAALPAGWRWSVCAFGAAELRCVATGALLGGHVRVGFENNLQGASGNPAADNAELVAGCRDALQRLGLRTATAREMRDLFLEPRLRAVPSEAS